MSAVQELEEALKKVVGVRNSLSRLVTNLNLPARAASPLLVRSGQVWKIVALRILDSLPHHLRAQ